MKTKNVMSRLSTAVFPPIRSHASQARLPEALFYSISALALLTWASSVLLTIAPKLLNSDLQTVLVKNAGASSLVIGLIVLLALSILGAISAVRARSLPAPSASVLLITAAALRALQILTDGSASVADANLLGGLFLASALLYYGPTRYWWFLLMPLALTAAFSPLVYLELFKGASLTIIQQAALLPTIAFVGGSILIALRELRARSIENKTTVAVLRLRGQNTMTALRAMESDLKNLRSIISGEATEVTALQTTEFAAPSKRAIEASDASSVDEIDAAARRLLGEARTAVEGRPVKLTLTAPTGTGLPIAVRGSIVSITAWMKSAILTSIEGLGGFPDGTVRVSIRPGLSALQILIEDNGRGFGESTLSRVGLTSDRLSITEIRAGVERIGGRLDLQSRLGVGSRLLIELPRVDAFANSPRAPRVSTPVASPQISEQLH